MARYVMTLHAGADFYIDNVQFTVTKIQGPTAFTLVRNHDGKAVSMTDDTPYKIAPSATAFVGLKGTTKVANVAIDAPRSVLIDPGTTYRKASRHPDR